jgi:hypothetical protein
MVAERPRGTLGSTADRASDRSCGHTIFSDRKAVLSRRRYLIKRSVLRTNYLNSTQVPGHSAIVHSIQGEIGSLLGKIAQTAARTGLFTTGRRSCVFG